MIDDFLTVTVLLSIIILVAFQWAGAIERDAQVRFGAPRPLPRAIVNEKLDIKPALRRSR